MGDMLVVVAVDVRVEFVEEDQLMYDMMVVTVVDVKVEMVKED